MRAAMRIDLGPARLVSGRPGGLGGRASVRGRAGPALAGGFERRWAGSTDIFKVLSNLFADLKSARKMITVAYLTSLESLNGKNHAGTGIPQLSQSPQL